MAKAPRGGAIALPIPKAIDSDAYNQRSTHELDAFEGALLRIPVFKMMREATIAGYGGDGWAAQLALLRLLNETELRENRGHR